MGSCISTPSTTNNTAIHSHSKNETECQVEKCLSELNSLYQEMRKFDDKDDFNVTIKRRMSRVISSVVAANDPTSPRSLPLNSLREAADGLQGLNDDTMNTILELKEEISENPELLLLVRDYFQNSSKTLNFFETIKRCLQNARKIETVVRSAIYCFQEKNYVKTLEKLVEFEAMGDPFTNEFVDELRNVIQLQRNMLTLLKNKKLELEDKYKTAKAWRKVWVVVYQSAFAATLICSVVLAAVSVPPVASAAAAAASTAFESVGQYCEALWRHYEDVIAKQKNIVEAMREGTHFAINELQNIRAMANNLEGQVRAMQSTSEFGVREEEELKVKIAMGEIESKVEEFSKMLKDLEVEVEKCNGNVKEASKKMLDAITGNKEHVGCGEVLDKVCCCCRRR